MSYVKQGDRRSFRANVDDGRGVGTVFVVDGYDRIISGIEGGDAHHVRTERQDETGKWVVWGYSVVGVHTEDEAIAEARREGFGSNVEVTA